MFDWKYTVFPFIGKITFTVITKYFFDKKIITCDKKTTHLIIKLDNYKKKQLVSRIFRLKKVT